MTSTASPAAKAFPRRGPASATSASIAKDLLRLYAAAALGEEENAADQATAVRPRDDWLLDTVIVAGRYFKPDYGPDQGLATRATVAVALGDFTAARADLAAMEPLREPTDDLASRDPVLRQRVESVRRALAPHDAARSSK